MSLCSCVPVCVVLCLCVSSSRTVNREIKDERVLWSSPPLAAQSGVLAKFPLWCRCGARLSFFHIDAETAADSGEVGVLSLAAGRRPAIGHAKPGTSTRGPEGSGGSKVNCPFSSSAFPLSLSTAVSLDLIRSSHGGPQEHPWLPVSGGGGAAGGGLEERWGGRTHIYCENVQGGMRSRQPGEDHCHVANFHHLREGETFPSTRPTQYLPVNHWRSRSTYVWVCIYLHLSYVTNMPCQIL